MKGKFARCRRDGSSKHGLALDLKTLASWYQALGRKGLAGRALAEPVAPYGSGTVSVVTPRLGVADQAVEVGFGDYRDAELCGFIELAARLFAGHHVIGVFRDAAGGAAAVLDDE